MADGEGDANVKRALLIIVIVAAAAGGFFLGKKGGAEKGETAEAAPADEEGTGIKIDHAENGDVVLNISDEVQGNMGLKVGSPVEARIAPEVLAYGRVQDPAPLAALATELATAQAAFLASSNELARLKTLSANGNASAKNLQAAEAAALHDQLAVQSARDRLAMSWGEKLAGQDDLAGLIQSLTTLDAALVRLDLPAGQTIDASPAGARVVTLSGTSADAEFYGTVASVDSQMQGRGFLFLLKPNSPHLLANEAVTGYLKLPGDPETGVIIPRAAVVRTDGAGWVYVMGASDEVYTRTPIPLAHPTDDGWFITNGITTKDHLVVGGAATLLSEEMKGLLKSD